MPFTFKRLLTGHLKAFKRQLKGLSKAFKRPSKGAIKAFRRPSYKLVKGFYVFTCLVVTEVGGYGGGLSMTDPILAARKSSTLEVAGFEKGFKGLMGV